jgi:beta-galactosidase
MNKKIIISIIILLSTIHVSLAQRKKINLDEEWKFAFGHAQLPEKDFNYGIKNIFSKSGNGATTPADVKFNDSTWRTLDLPHDWAVELPFVHVDNVDVESHGYKPVGGLFPATSIGWYRKHFTVTKADSGKRIQLQFDGIFRDANIWINGFYLGNNKSGYVGIEYDITDFILFDKDNIITVRVDATQYEGWFYEGAGIYRHVWLNIYNNTHIDHDGLFIYASHNNNKATVTIETTIQQQQETIANLTIQCLLKSREGKTIAVTLPQKIRVNPLQEQTFTQSITVNNPILWQLENPYLYRVVVQLKKDNEIIDEVTEKFGIRNLVIKPDGVYLNDQHIKIKGTNNHQDHAGVGVAQHDYLHYYRISLLKNMGANAYRSSHHIPTKELLDACDSLGMLVMSEQRLLNSGLEYMQQFEKLVKRDRSRTCVFMWSIGNEEGWIQTTDIGKRIALTFIQKLKQLDPTRTCTYAADVANVYKGVNEVIPVRGFNYREYAVEAYHKEHPLQPIIGTEMGSTVTTRGEWYKNDVKAYLPDQDITFPWWASTAEKWWSLAANNNFWLGGFIWTGFDYRGEPTPYKWPNINSHFGVMDVCGFPKNIYYYYKSWWTDEDVIHLSPHWNHSNEWGKPPKQIDVWVNTNADSVALFLNNKSLGVKLVPKNSHVKWNVTFEPGTLEAIGYKKGRIIKALQQTTDLPYEVVVTPNKTTLVADGKDISVINITVVDKYGRAVPDANNVIEFSLEGNAKIIGVGNGDPSSHEADKCEEGLWKRSLFNGKCQVLIQAGKIPGLIKFEAKAKGLYTGSTDIVTVDTKSLNTYTINKKYQLTDKEKLPNKVDKMLGADISYLPELEANGIKFSDKGVVKDATEILKDHGFNYVRLRLFHTPENDSGYSPQKGFCNLQQTLLMAKRVKQAGLKLLLDFHYSDYWADPGKQYLPKAWQHLNFEQLQQQVYNYTYNVMQQLQQQGTLPNMVQLGNEINHGILWPYGSVLNIDQTAQLLCAATKAVKTVDASVQLMLHIALGGQNHESVFFIDNMLARDVHFDVIAQSYYPKWHSTTEDLEHNLKDLIKRYNKDVIVVEYSALKEKVNDIVFNLPNNRGKGTCIWEPLNTWEKIFDNTGASNNYILLYDEFKKKYLE